MLLLRSNLSASATTKLYEVIGRGQEFHLPLSEKSSELALERINSVRCVEYPRSNQKVCSARWPSAELCDSLCVNSENAGKRNGRCGGIFDWVRPNFHGRRTDACGTGACVLMTLCE